MLATDRWQWSSKDGKKERKKESFHLPNRCWEWEGDWFVDKSIECDVEVSTCANHAYNLCFILCFILSFIGSDIFAHFSWA